MTSESADIRIPRSRSGRTARRLRDVLSGTRTLQLETVIAIASFWFVAVCNLPFWRDAIRRFL